MNHIVGKIRNIRTIKALRGDPLSIDLGKTFDGVLEAWMKSSPNSETYRSFDIVDNRYLTLSREKTSDYYFQGELVEEIKGRWYFDVEFTKAGDPISNKKTIYTGTILFVNDITGGNGIEALIDEALFNIEGGNSQSVYLDEQLIDLGDSSTT